jgi:hypothetical protein
VTPPTSRRRACGGAISGGDSDITDGTAANSGEAARREENNAYQQHHWRQDRLPDQQFPEIGRTQAHFPIIRAHRHRRQAAARGSDLTADTDDDGELGRAERNGGRLDGRQRRSGGRRRANRRADSATTHHPRSSSAGNSDWATAISPGDHQHRRG